jgi:enoyl-CoA hydratase/carnithine racemase
MGTGPAVVLSVDDAHVATITLNRPGKQNAIDAELAGDWEWALSAAAKDDAVHSIVFAAAGRDFSIGLDLDEFDAVDRRDTAGRKHFFWRGLHRIALILERLDKPVIAALNGVTRGEALDIALMCDLRIAGASASLGDDRAELGLIAGDGGSYFLPRLIGCARTLEMFWTGKDLEATAAERIGLVNHVVPDDEVISAATEIARKIAAKPQEAVRYFKRAVYQGLDMQRRTHLDLVSSHIAILMTTDEHKERLAAVRAGKVR